MFLKGTTMLYALQVFGGVVLLIAAAFALLGIAALIADWLAMRQMTGPRWTLRRSLINITRNLLTNRF